MSRPDFTRVAVVGGGISGLAAAWFLRTELGDSAEIIVLEKSPRIGGHLRVSDIAGLPVDEGAESLLARRPEAVGLVEAVGLDAAVVHPASVSSGLWSRGRMHPMPTGTVMGVPSDSGALTGILTPEEIEATGADRTIEPMHVEGDVSIGDLVAARMGRAVVDRVVEPLLGGVYAGDAYALSMDATVPALGAAVRRHSRLSDAVAEMVPAAPPDSGRDGPGHPPGPVFAGLRGGVGTLPAAVAEASGARVETGVTVRELHRTGSGWRLVTGPVPHPRIVEADAVVVATPAGPSARLLDGVAPAAAAELAAVETASMAIVTLALPAAAFPEQPASSGFLVPPADARTIKAVTYSSVKWPWLGAIAGDLVVLRASVGRYRQVEILQRDDDDIVAAVMTDLRDAAGIAGAPVAARVTRWGGALPQYSVGHLDRVRRVLSAVEPVDGLAVCGALYQGVGVAACIASAREAATRVVAHLSDKRVRIET